MSDTHGPDHSLDPSPDLAPHDEAHSAVQIHGICALLDPGPRRVLDLGCGDGRVLVPLVEAGHHVVGVDRDASVLDTIGAATDPAGTTLVEADFTRPGATAALAADHGPFDAILCLGNTFCLIHDTDAAVDLLAAWRAALAPGGAIVIDDIPQDLWPEVAGGNWNEGISPEGDMQMVWDASDAVFAIRTGDAVDDDHWTLQDSDVRCRLWTTGALRLAARAAGLSAPRREDASAVLVMRAAAAG